MFIKPLIVCFPLSSGLPLQPCPDSYSEYNNKCYKLSTEQMTFGEAKAVCQRDGGILAIINAQDTNHLVVKKIRLPYERTLSYWIGLSDAQEEGTFVWTDGTELTASDYTHWRPGNPDNAVVGDGEDCVEIRQELDYMWNDVDCRKKRHFVCEKGTENTVTKQ
uniref:C-type lectin domain-containing protein n=1 Tax=Branchiostoma floridae TaxID=7739 RepID=C3Y1U3_BRAFL|eukprot:XP_002609823.1 hypothetical protein BRAFLDRAFT_219540 [Branchiostoma floridae]